MNFTLHLVKEDAGKMAFSKEKIAKAELKEVII